MELQQPEEKQGQATVAEAASVQPLLTHSPSSVQPLLTHSPSSVQPLLTNSPSSVKPLLTNSPSNVSEQAQTIVRRALNQIGDTHLAGSERSHDFHTLCPPDKGREGHEDIYWSETTEQDRSIPAVSICSTHLTKARKGMRTFIGVELCEQRCDTLLAQRSTAGTEKRQATRTVKTLPTSIYEKKMSRAEAPFIPFYLSHQKKQK
eukprot:1158422-Pelagomonas_calceolata.AAC.4